MENEALNLAPREAADKIKEFGYKKITVMFDHRNYLFTDCKTIDYMHNVLAVENHNGDFMYLKDYNCGYGGTGPSKTMELFNELGLNLDDNIKYSNGLQLVFDETGSLYNGFIDKGIYKDFPFDIRRRNPLEHIYLSDKYTITDLKAKKLYFLGLDKDNFLAVIRILGLPEITLIKSEYYIGEENDLHVSFPYVPMNVFGENKISKLAKGSYLGIRTNLFEIVAFLGDRMPVSYINAMSVFLNGYPVFCEDTVNDKFVLFSKGAFSNTKFKYKLLSRKPAEIKGEILINDSDHFMRF